MRSMLCVTAAALALTLVAAFPAQAALPAKAKITTVGLGPLKIGMSKRQAERVIGRRIRLTALHSRSCMTGRIGHKTWVMFRRSTLMRVSVEGRRYATRSGVRVGDSERKVLDTYPGQLVRTPHAYYAGGEYLKILDGRHKVVFETRGDGRVMQISTGRTPHIDYIEGCA